MGNRSSKTLFDFSLSKRILLCSPITLYAILSLIRQAVSNFSLEQRAGDMQAMVSTFKVQWEKFVEKLNALGKSIGTIQKHFDELRCQFAVSFYNQVRRCSRNKSPIARRSRKPFPQV